MRQEVSRIVYGLGTIMAKRYALLELLFALLFFRNYWLTLLPILAFWLQKYIAVRHSGLEQI